MVAPEGFAEAVHALAESFVPLNNAQAEEFLAAMPLDVCFRELSGPQATASLIEDATAAFAKIFATELGASLLPSIPPYASAALQSPSAPLRRLAVQQLGRLLASQAEPPPQCLDLLLVALQDPDVGVGSDAEAALRQLASPQAAVHVQLSLLLSAQHPFGARVGRLSSCANPVLRMRALTLLVGLAAYSPVAAEAVQESGMLELLLRELRDPDDLLSCMAALQLIRDAAELCDDGMAAALGQAVAPRLAVLLQHPEPALQSWALKAAASLLSTSLQAGTAHTVVDGPAVIANGEGAGAGGVASAAAPLLAALKGVLDVGSEAEVAQELEDAALDAVAILGLHVPSAEALLTDASGVAGDVAYKALGCPPSSAQRIAALHALAAVAGAERSGRNGKLLSEEAEAALRVAVFEGAAAAWPGATPAQVLQQQLEQPFLEQRVAVYRCLAALVARDWMAGQVCGHALLLAFLLNSHSECSKQGCEWRHACICSLAATVADVTAGGIGAGGPHHAALLVAEDSVQAAVRAGPFGASSAGAPEHMVATLPGL